MAHRVEDLLGPDDDLVFQCVTCGEYFLPREYHVLKRTYRSANGEAFTEAFELCPACYPAPSLLRQETDPHPSGYLVLTKADFLEKRRYEKIGLVAPNQKYMTQNLD